MDVPEPLTEHCRRVVRGMAQGRVVPLLGAGVNLCGRPADGEWEPGKFLPSGTELAEYIAREFDYPKDEAAELARVSEHAYVLDGSGPLYQLLHDVFDAHYPIGPLHRFLAELPQRFADTTGRRVTQLIVTTNYDDALERAFTEAGEEYDLVCYLADGEHRGKFVHWAPEREPTVIERPNEYRGLTPDERTVILKIHGNVDRSSTEYEWDSYVITEDHYIDYLASADISNLIPATLLRKLRRSHFLFLGYSMRDWNVRVILQRIWGEQMLKYKSWTVQLAPGRLEREYWEKVRGVDVLDLPLERYVEGLGDAFARPLDLPLAT
jgi:hypothetical protein